MVLRVSRLGVIGLVWVCAVGTLLAGTTHAGVLDKVGAMGDSLTDESWSVEHGLLAEEDYINWTEHLTNSGKVSFGPRGNYPSPRGDSYQYNFARAGVTSAQLIERGQHTGLAAESPTLAYLGIGGNDFAYHIIQHANRFVGDGEDPMVLVPQMVANFRTAMETVAGTADNPTGSQMILATVPDLGRSPSIEYVDGLGHLIPGSLTLYRNAATAVNDQIKAMGAERGFPVVDLFALFDAFKGPLDDPYETFEFGGVDIFLGKYDEEDVGPTNAFLSDYFHPGTVVHGIMANMFLEALNTGYGQDIPLFSDQEILLAAGVEPGTPPGVTTYLDVSPYVVVPEPGALTFLLIGGVFLRRRQT